MFDIIHHVHHDGVLWLTSSKIYSTISPIKANVLALKIQHWQFATCCHLSSVVMRVRESAAYHVFVIYIFQNSDNSLVQYAWLALDFKANSVYWGWQLLMDAIVWKLCLYNRWQISFPEQCKESTCACMDITRVECPTHALSISNIHFSLNVGLGKYVMWMKVKLSNFSPELFSLKHSHKDFDYSFIYEALTCAINLS